MFHLDPDGRYVDVMERAIYNSSLSGLSYDGKQFFYGNPLAAYPGVNPLGRWSDTVEGGHYRRVDWLSLSLLPAKHIASHCWNRRLFLFAGGKSRLHAVVSRQRSDIRDCWSGTETGSVNELPVGRNGKVLCRSAATQMSLNWRCGFQTGVTTITCR